jgi:hypothetical protein
MIPIKKTIHLENLHERNKNSLRYNKVEYLFKIVNL